MLDRRGSCIGLQRHEIRGDGAHVGVGGVGKRAGDRAHLSDGRAVFAGEAAAQIVDELRLRPGLRPLPQVHQRRRVPAFDRAALQRRVVPLGAEPVHRRVACAAMTEAFRKISAARHVLRRRAGMRIVRARLQIEQVPRGHQRPEAERKRQVVLRRARGNGIAAHEPCIECGDVVIAHMREVGIRERRIEQMTIARHTPAHSARESIERPSADAAVGVGRDVGRIDNAEGCGERQSARERLAAGRRVTGEAIAARRVRWLRHPPPAAKGVRRAQADPRARGPRGRRMRRR